MSKDSTTVTTNASGIAQFNSTAGDGWYTFTETAAPFGYERNPSPVRVYLTAGVTGEIRLANTKDDKDGSLEIRKVDIDDPTQGIAGAVIRLTHPASGRTSTFTSGADGWCVIPQAFVDEMLTGLWEAEEITPPAGYRLNPDPNITKQTFAWDGGRTPVSLVFTNDSDVSIRFRKVDADAPTRGLAGATIAVYKDGTPITTAVTDAQGYITLNGVTEGFYVFKELNPPAGYALDVDPYVGVHIDPAQIAGNETIEVTMVNHKTPTLRIRKVDVETGNGIANTRFSVVGVNNNYSNTVTTDADGWAVLTDVDAAVYEITELSVPAPYILDTNNRMTVALRAGEDHSFTFTNGKEPGLRIIKKDLISGDVVPGVTFRIEKIDGTYSTELTTDAHGEVFFEHIAAGAYRVQEIAVPGDYLLSNEIKTVNLESNKTTTLEFFNSKKPGLRIFKKDAVTDEYVEGVTFRIEKIDGTFSTELTTDANGEVFIPNLAAGAYRVQEIAVPGNYILDTTVKTVTLEADSTAILEFRNYQRPGLLIKKTTSDGQNLEGARFNVKVKDGSSIGDFTTDARGEIFIPNLTAQWYTITETYVPEGYILDSTPHDVLLEAGASGDGKVYQTYSVVNHAKPKLTVYKVDSVVGGSVEGAKFQITFAGENQNGSVRDLGVHVSDRNGEIKLENLDVGWYRIKEISAPDGYQLNNEEKLVYLQADDVKSVTFENTPLNAIIVLKRDSVSGEPVEGCTFQLRYLSGTSGTGGTVIGTQTTSTTGTAIWTGLQAGTYIIEEVRAADGYVITETAQTVYLSGNAQDTVTVYFDNNPKGSLLIKKVCSNNPSVMLAGAQFEVKYTDGSFIGNTNGIYTTNANGEILITDLVPNKSVVVTEIKAPDGFVKDTAPQSIEIKAGQVVTLTFANAPKGRLIIEKRDSTNNQLLAGAEFRVTTAAGCEVGQNGVIGEATATSTGLFRTGADGKITLTNLIPGNYIVTEVSAPDGYLIDDPTRTVTITKGDTQTVVFKDTPKGTLTVQKLDSRTHKPLASAQFRITDSSGAALDNHGGTVSSNGYYETNAEGRIDIYDVLPDTYVVTEIKAPAGYAIDNASQTVKLNANDHQTLTFYDTALTTLVIHKYIDGTANEPLQGVRFKVVDGEGAAVGPDDGVYYTDANGEIVLTGLEPGTTVKAWETKTVAGFVLDGTPQDIKIKAGEAQTLTFWNKRLGSLVVEKQDSITGAPLAGAEFRITYESDNNGYVHLSKTLKDGRYYVREIVAPEGYILDNNTKSFYVISGETATIEWKNTPQLAQIQIVKTSADYNPTNGLPAGTPLPDAVYTVYDKRMNVVDTIRTNASGVANTKMLPLGFYHVKETTAPANYGIDTATYDVELEFVGQVYRLNLTNKSVATRVEIRKSGPQMVVNGQNLMMYRISGVRNDSTVALQSFYWRDTLPVDAFRLSRITTGTYSSTQSYKVTYTTNYDSTWRTAYDNLSTAKNYTLDMSATALGLCGGEYVTEVMLSFGIVPAGFHQLTEAAVYGSVLRALVNGYQFTNKADVGGLLGGHWEQSVARWTTTVMSTWMPPALPAPKLPRTGY